MKARLSVFLIFTACLCAAQVTGQLPDDQDQQNESSPPLTFSALETETIILDKAFIKRYLGDVIATQLDVEINADNVEYNSRLGEARFYGNTSFKDSLRLVIADSIVYYYERREALAQGEVKVTEKGRLFQAERVFYQKDLRRIEATGGVYIHDDSLRSTITGHAAVFNDSTRNGVITGNPLLVRTDEEGSIITISCLDTLEILRERKTVRLWNNVTMNKDSLKVLSDRAVYNDSTEIVTLSGSPRAEHVSMTQPVDAPSELRMESTVSGDSMLVYLQDRQVKTVEVIGSAHTTTASTDTSGALFDRSILDSRRMRLDMNNNVVSLVTADGTATSYYHRAALKDDEMIVNEASGDTIYFFFDEGKITRMRITGMGGSGAEGKYYGFKPASSVSDEDSLYAADDPE